MIQLNTTSLFGPPDPPDALAPSGRQASDAFQHDLSAALDATLKNFGIDPANVTFSIAPAVSTPPGVTPFSPPPPAANLVVTSPPGPSAPPVPTAPPEDPAQSFDDAYWAKQPAAVQALRTIDDYDKRMQLVSQLTAQGYNIDVPIMAWGWDPAKVTAARQSYGYTWVPSALQKPLPEAPGVSLPGIQAYDPHNPPDGSIAV